MRILIGCECSGITREAFAALGHDVLSVDYKPTEIPGNHIEDSVISYLDKGWDMAIFMPPCTFLANAQIHLIDRDEEVEPGVWRPRRELREVALSFVKTLLAAPIPRIALENPTGYINMAIRKWDQKVRPWEHGEGVQKEICLWLKNLPKLKPTHVVEGRRSSWWHETPGPQRKANKSRSFKGIAAAMAQQWGTL